MAAFTAGTPVSDSIDSISSTSLRSHFPKKPYRGVCMSFEKLALSHVLQTYSCSILGCA